ncbi:DUF4232 domain-containing protein [Mycobacterium sp. Aquia_216]|uniref:DUF4232 domain-containing protein n=1 Tax=Mycobacterium sp. Aquia_216 TaxID=2991729 RepID=UPI00227AF46B|nr:DUF4232 domain-containing protein [Mycobacterium sp. Aquia_216]WAJ44902.1 DUF4232 domain-containing protein [Mycobacterium sp. Aquia_216]
MAAVLAPHAWAVPAGEQALPCRSEQVAVTASPTQGAVGHRALTLTFSLAGGGEPCTLTGYPSVETGTGGPDLHAKPTLRGYMGGLPSDVDDPPTVTLSLAGQGQAIVEGMAVDGKGNPCPSYTALRVNPPDTVIVLTVPATIDACELQVHPVTVLE